MTTAQMRAARLGFVYDGQSLNDNPYVPGTGYSYVLTAALDAIQSNPPAWRGGMAIGQLGSSLHTRVQPFAGIAQTTIYHLMGGTTDIAVGATGLVTYGLMADLADRARAYGFPLVVAATVSDAAGFGAPQDAIRADLNNRIRADALGAFDGVIDVVPNPGQDLDDSASSSFTDGTHWSFIGQNIARAIAIPIIEGLL